MNSTLKPLAEQTIVITGVSSGIGLATAFAARAGARVVLTSRNEAALQEAVRRIESGGGRASYVVADVTKPGDLEHAAQETEAFGGFDTWVNNAGLGIFGRLQDVSEEDSRRLFDVNFWGLVSGSRIAASHLATKGGAIINLGSVVSDVAFPIQGMYAASKHAIKGFTDAFRMELRERGVPISVTLIKPSAINTPFARHARNYLSQEPKLPPRDLRAGGRRRRDPARRRAWRAGLLYRRRRQDDEHVQQALSERGRPARRPNGARRIELRDAPLARAGRQSVRRRRGRIDARRHAAPGHAQRLHQGEHAPAGAGSRGARRGGDGAGAACRPFTLTPRCGAAYDRGRQDR